MQPILVLETSGASLGVALISDRGVLFEENVSEGLIHGRALAPLMERALASQGLKAAGLGALGVSLGPGSWTGLRIGISAAKTFAWAARVPLVCVPSFEALAAGAGLREPDARNILTLRDARSEGFFAALFDVTAGAPRRLMNECVLKPEELVPAVKQMQNSSKLSEIAVCGDEKCLALIAEESARNGWRLINGLQHISAGDTARRALARWLSGVGVLKSAQEIHWLGPLYLRASDPELKLSRTAASEAH